MNRRGFFKGLFGAAVGALGLSRLPKQEEEPKKPKCFCDSAEQNNFTYVVATFSSECVPTKIDVYIEGYHFVPELRP